jgi:chromosome segregation ATPase
MMWGDANDPVKAWRIDADRREQQYAEARAQQKREQERYERQIARASAREEIAALRAELAELRGEFESLNHTLADTMNATARAFATLADERREQHATLAELKTVVAKLGASPEAKRAAFQFAREKSDAEVVDLPDFIRKMN